MIFTEKKVVLQDGRICVLRSPEPEDARDLLVYLKQTSAETPFMIRYPEEITLSVEAEQIILKAEQESTDSIMIAAVIDDKIVGNTGMRCVGNRIKLRHRAQFGIAILKDYWQLGIASNLLTEMLAWAKELGFEQIELEVASPNERAIQLYEKFGFQKYGTRERAFKFKDGTYCAEHLMMKKL